MVDRATEKPGLGFGLVMPVAVRILEQLSDGRGHIDRPVRAIAARFDQKDAIGWVLAQSGRENTAGRPRADNDIIKFFVHSLLRWHFSAQRIRVSGHTACSRMGQMRVHLRLHWLQPALLRLDWISAWTGLVSTS